jgi:hypothetical protein
MHLKKRTIQDLQRIIKRDYGQSLSEEEVNEFGISILRLTRLALTAQARALEKAEKQKS